MNAKDKTAAKAAKAKTKAKAKVAAKCGCKKGGKACAALVAVLALASVLSGCNTMGSQPAKSQTMNVSYCTVNVYATPTGITNGVPTAASSFGDILCQAQSLESSGTETYSPTASPTQDIKPQTDISVPVNKAGAAQSVGSVLGDAVAGLIKGTTSGAAKDAGAQAVDTVNAVSGDCTDGSCTPTNPQ